MTHIYVCNILRNTYFLKRDFWDYLKVKNHSLEMPEFQMTSIFIYISFLNVPKILPDFPEALILSLNNVTKNELLFNSFKNIIFREHAWYCSMDGLDYI